MAVTKFKFKKRNIEKDAVRVVEVTDTDDEYFGRFHLKFQDFNSIEAMNVYRASRNALSEEDQQRYDRIVDEKDVTDEDREWDRRLGISMFVDNYIVDSDIPGDEEETATYKHDPAILKEYLGDPENDFVWRRVASFARSASNFRREKEQKAKNA